MFLSKPLSRHFEYFIFFFLVPGLYFLKVISLHLFLFLWLGFLVALLVIRYDHRFRETERFWSIGDRKTWRRVLGRFLILGTLTSLVVYFLLPTHFLAMPRENPQLWLTVLVLYPILSVFPQSFIYRVFMHFRYRRIFPTDRWFALAGAFAFGFMHIIFRNWIAVIITTIGGYIFLSTYLRSRSYVLASVEHALYGNFIFTIGLGRYIYHGYASGMAMEQ